MALVLAILVAIGAAAGAWGATAAAIFALLTTGGVTFLLLFLHRDFSRQKTAVAVARDTLSRHDAIFSTLDAGWCLFDADGLLLASQGFETLVPGRQLKHFDDLVAAIDHTGSLVEQFRKLQQTGRGFELTLCTMDDHKTFILRGRRHPEQGAGALYNIIHMRDVTAAAVAENAAETRQRAEAARTEALHSALDALDFPLWIRDRELRLSWCNAAYARWCDAPRDAVLAKQIELMPQQGARGGGRDLAMRAAVAPAAVRERRHMVVDGARHLIECAERRTGDAAGDFHMLGAAQDVTAVEEKEGELARHVAAQHEVLESLGTPIVIYDADQRLAFYNRAYVRLWDIDESFLALKPTFGEILEDLRARRRMPEQVDFPRYKRDRMSLFTSLIEPREDMLHLPDGMTLRVVAVPHPLGGLMFMHEDVTDKLALESSYNTLIAVQRETLDNLAEGIAVFGADGRLKLFNPAFERIWQLLPEELRDEPHVNELVEKMKKMASAERWAEFRRDMIGFALERAPRSGRMQRADETIIAFNTVPLPDGAMLNSFIDVTDSTRVEQALRASNAALAAADRLKSEFVANVSYQLRTPLNTIMGFAEILANQYFGTLNERQLEYAKTMMESSKRLKLLIDDVIDLAIIDAGRMTLTRRRSEIVPLLQSVAGMLGEWARQQSLELVIDAEPGIGYFDVDEKRIKQVLFNLVSNAIQYTPPGGRITLMARRDGVRIDLSVADTGIGIPQQDQDRIWLKFERSNAQARQSGVGLGLSLVRNFIELHGGEVRIESQINQGTKVSCMIPIHAPVSSQAAVAQAGE